MTSQACMLGFFTSQPQIYSPSAEPKNSNRFLQLMQQPSLYIQYFPLYTTPPATPSATLPPSTATVILPIKQSYHSEDLCLMKQLYLYMRRVTFIHRALNIPNNTIASPHISHCIFVDIISHDCKNKQSKDWQTVIYPQMTVTN